MIRDLEYFDTEVEAIAEGDRCACAFSKDGIKELIDTLSEILEALED